MNPGKIFDLEPPSPPEKVEQRQEHTKKSGFLTHSHSDDSSTKQLHQPKAADEITTTVKEVINNKSVSDIHGTTGSTAATSSATHTVADGKEHKYVSHNHHGHSYEKEHQKKDDAEKEKKKKDDPKQDHKNVSHNHHGHSHKQQQEHNKEKQKESSAKEKK